MKKEDKKPVDKDDSLEIEGTLDDVLKVSVPQPEEDKKDDE
ncbi:hypothetical protein [Winogradskyella sp.]|nr:hypothetical protein [Winogradskyella sp.]